MNAARASPEGRQQGRVVIVTKATEQDVGELSTPCRMEQVAARLEATPSKIKHSQKSLIPLSSEYTEDC